MAALMHWFQDRMATLRASAEKGAAAVEYGLLVALIAVAIIGAVIALGGKVTCTFSNTAGAYPNNAGNTSPTVTGC